MGHPNGSTSDRLQTVQLLALAREVDASVTERTLEFWRHQGLLPRPGRSGQSGKTPLWTYAPEAANQLVRDSLAMEKADPAHEKYHGIFLSHTGVDKPFARQLRKDLMARGVPRVWLDEAEIDIGDSLIAKIEEGIKLSRYIAVVLSTKSIGAPWVKKELDVAMNREIASGEVVVLPLLYEACELPV